MNILKTQEGSTLTIALEGRLDTTTSPQLEGELRSSVNGISELIFDLGALDYISSAGLRVLMWLEVEMEKRGGEVQVTHAPESVLKIFELAGFMDVVHVITE